MSEQHTPGPWIIRKDFTEIGPIGWPVAWLNQSHPNQANARLIAAAPDLLEAAKGLTTLSRSPDGARIVGPQGWDRLQAAIAKAEGNA